MTANEMRYNLNLLYDKLFEYSAPAYDDKQLSSFLTKAQNVVFKKKIINFEKDELKRRDLEQFIKPATPTLSVVQTGVHPNGKFYDMPSDFLYAIEEAVVTSVSTPDEINVLPVTHDFYNRNINNPYKKPYKDLVWRMDISRVDHGEDGGNTFTGRTAKRTELIPATGTTITSYRLRYLAEPPAIVCDSINPANQRHCIMDEITHSEIVDLAVKFAAASTTPETYSVHNQEQKENEF